MSYTTSYYHIVIRTYRSEPTINEEHERELYAYIHGIAKNLKCQTYRIGGISDHLHMFVSLPSYLSLASFVQRVNRKKTFAEEHRAFLTENGVSIDERYFLRDD